MTQTVADSVAGEIKRKDEKAAAFNEQIQKFRDFKKKLDDAGFVYGDKYEIPLMSRIQSNLKPK